VPGHLSQEYTLAGQSRHTRQPQFHRQHFPLLLSPVFLLFPFSFHLSRVAAIAAALPCAAVAILAAFPSLSPFFPVAFPPCSSLTPAGKRKFPAASRPRGRHTLGGGNGKYSFPAIPFLLPRFSFCLVLFSQHSVRRTQHFNFPSPASPSGTGCPPVVDPGNSTARPCVPPAWTPVPGRRRRAPC
jgi:hypothetical protein